MTYAFSFTDKNFRKIQPSLRPPKRCGAKIVLDDSWNHLLAVGGGYHNFDNSYYEPSLQLTKLVEEGAESSLVPRTLAVWAFNTESGQWYAMRPLQHSAPAGYAPHGGYSGNYCFASEYGLALLAPTNSEKVHAYSAYSNQWVLLPQNKNGATSPPDQEKNLCVAYDLKNRRMVWMNANNTTDTTGSVKTWAFDIGTKMWTLLSLHTNPSRSVPGWYFSYGAMTYDRKNASLVYLHSSGAETWVLHADSNGWEKRTPSPRPPSCGNMGEGLTYDINRNVVLVYTNHNDEVWTYKTGNGITGRPNPPLDLTGTTTASGITLSWSAPSGGTTPAKYRIYRAPWDDNKTNGSAIVPYSYVLIDSTTGTSYEDNSDTLKTAETFHSYFVEAVSASGIASDPSTPAYTRLRIPFGLVATAYANNNVVLRWKPKRESDFVGYNLYRYQRNYPFQRQMLSRRVNTSLITEPFFVDTTVRLCGTSICTDSLAMYCVTAVNRLGKESGLSPFATTAPDWPTNLWADTVNKVISWSPPRNGNLGNYRIYSARQGGWFTGSEPMVFSASTADTFWSYASQPTVKCYKVRAYSKMGQVGHFSDVLAIQTKDSLVFGNYKLDFQAERPIPDNFFDDVPGISAEIGSLTGLTTEYLAVNPNPFNASVRFTIKQNAGMNESSIISIFDIAGKLLQKIPVKKLEKGNYVAQWNASENPAGVYFASLKIDGKSIRKKITLTK
jgi:hypothetical protein